MRIPELPTKKESINQLRARISVDDLERWFVEKSNNTFFIEIARRVLGFKAEGKSDTVLCWLGYDVMKGRNILEEKKKGA